MIFIITSCKKKDDAKPEFYLQRGIEAAQNHNYQSCIFHLNKIDEVAPYSVESKTAAPILAFCNYAIKDYEAMYSEIESFESLYPTSPELPYLYYIKTLSYFKTFKNHKKSLRTLESLKSGIQKVNDIDPDGMYAQDLNKIIPFIDGVHEKNSLYIANGYASTNNFISAAARYSSVYKTTADEETKKTVENSMTSVLSNLGIVKNQTAVQAVDAQTTAVEVSEKTIEPKN